MLCSWEHIHPCFVSWEHSKRALLLRAHTTYTPALSLESSYTCALFFPPFHSYLAATFRLQTRPECPIIYFWVWKFGSQKRVYIVLGYTGALVLFIWNTIVQYLSSFLQNVTNPNLFEKKLHNRCHDSTLNFFLEVRIVRPDDLQVRWLLLMFTVSLCDRLGLTSFPMTCTFLGLTSVFF